MRRIHKTSETSSLREWKRKNNQRHYNDLPDDIRRLIRQQALEEQFYLCAYCCQSIKDLENCHNEHVEPRHLKPDRELDYTNIVASCETANQCGKAKNSQRLPLTPLMPECETELRFKISGRVEGLSKRAKTTIEVLNLGDRECNNRALIQKRKQLSDALLWSQNVNPQMLQMEDEGILDLLIDELAQPQQGKLEPFAPVVINILRNLLKGEKLE